MKHVFRQGDVSWEGSKFKRRCSDVEALLTGESGKTLLCGQQHRETALCAKGRRRHIPGKGAGSAKVLWQELWGLFEEPKEDEWLEQREG